MNFQSSGVYNPPISFYTQINTHLSNSDMYQIIGKSGCNFKYLTKKFNLNYIWWNEEKNVIEVWGKHINLTKAKEGIQNYIETFEFSYKKYNDDFCGFQFSSTVIEDIFEF